MQLYNGWTIMSYETCCRISTLLNNNHDRNIYLNFMVNGSETYSLINTGLAREYFVQYNPIDYILPAVHPDPSYSFSFAFVNTAYIVSNIGTINALFIILPPIQLDLCLVVA